ncbi:putative reverse transcriptase domain-containing protein [Tanacetum coccineum]
MASPLLQIPSPPLPVSSPVPISHPPLHASPTYPLEYRATMIRLRAETPSTSHPLPSSTPPSGTAPFLSIPLATPSPPLLLPSTDCRSGVSKVTLPPQKRLCIALGLRYEVGKSSSAPTARPTEGFRADYGFVAILDDEIRHGPEIDVGYRITDTWDKMLVGIPGALATDDTELGRRMTNFVTTIRQDTDEIYGRLDEAQDARDQEARLSREAWGRSMDASDTTRSKARALRTTVLAPLTEIAALRAADRARQAQLVETLRPMSTLQTQWFERMETVFRISNCFVENQIKFSTCTLLGSALTWWNSHVKTVGHGVAYAMTWKDQKKKMTDKYCPRGEIQKLEVKMWNLKVKGTNVVTYNQRFQELALMCARMFPEESDKIEKYVSGLPDMIHGSVMASKPKTMQDAIEFATELMDKKIRTFVER